MNKKTILLLITLIFSFLTATPTKKEFSEQFITVAEQGNPVVVSIISETIREQNMFHGFGGFGFPEEFEDMFPQHRERGRSLGSGVIIDNLNGYIITNNHVIENAEEVKVVLYDDREFEATIVGAHEASDIAVLKIDATLLSNAELGNSDELQVGEWVIAIGSPFGLNLNHTVTAGIISATGRSDVISSRNFEDFIQHDAAINPGNSGGALFDLDGKLIGINNAIITDGFSRSNAGVGFAIPINQVKRVMYDIIDLGDVQGAWLGIAFQEITENLAEALNLADTKGVIITEVLDDSPAKLAGFKSQDVITQLDDKNIKNTSDLKNTIFQKYPNSEVTIMVIRNGEKIEKKVILGTRPSDEEMMANIDSKEFDILGLKVSENEASGVKITSVKKKSSSENEGIRTNDIITQIGDIVITNLNDYYSNIGDLQSGDIVLLQITTINQSKNFRQSYSRLLAIKLD